MAIKLWSKSFFALEGVQLFDHVGHVWISGDLLLAILELCLQLGSVFLDLLCQLCHLCLLVSTQLLTGLLVVFLLLRRATRALFLLELIHACDHGHNTLVFVLLSAAHTLLLQLLLQRHDVCLQLLQLVSLCFADACCFHLFLWLLLLLWFLLVIGLLSWCGSRRGRSCRCRRSCNSCCLDEIPILWLPALEDEFRIDIFFRLAEGRCLLALFRARLLVVLAWECIGLIVELLDFGIDSGLECRRRIDVRLSFCSALLRCKKFQSFLGKLVNLHGTLHIVVSHVDGEVTLGTAACPKLKV